MLSNNQIRNIIGSQVKNCSEAELSNIREFLTALASIEYASYCDKREQIDAAKTIILHDISN
jgi:hypothetical protein